VTQSLKVYDTIPESAMVIVAHPDDAEFMVAGTVARWTAAGAQVTYLLVTDGDKGSSDPDMASHTLAALRREEQRAACAVLGVRQVEFLHYADGMVEPSLTLRRDIARVIRRYRPQAALIQDPQFFYGGEYINHPDHRAAGEAALGAIYPAARDRLTFPELLAEGLEPHKVRDVFIGMAMRGDTIIDISDFIDKKIESLLAHRSQMRDWNPSDMMREWSSKAAEGQTFTHGEVFHHIKLED
jgi:LmbE family N-acetylglucosaminyl deacetylase